MPEFDPGNIGPDELLLTGRLQIQTALDILLAKGVNPEGQAALMTMIRLHDMKNIQKKQTGFLYYIHGQTAAELKRDITKTAELVIVDQSARDDARIAASGLLEVLKAQK